MIESVEGVNNLDQICAIPGVHAVFVGPNDLAFSMLEPGQSLTSSSGSSGDGADSWTTFARTPEVLASCGRILEAAQSRGMPFGMTAGDPHTNNPSTIWIGDHFGQAVGCPHGSCAS